MTEPHEYADSDLSAFTESLQAALTDLGIWLHAGQRDRMARHFTLLVEANRSVNLTRITSAREAAVKHYADSLSILACPELHSMPNGTVLDVGTGGGFPAVPLAIARPAWCITAIDGTRKKSDHVAGAAATLGLGNLMVRHARSRDLAAESRTYDLVTFRAVADAMTCVKEARRLVTAQGWVACYLTRRQADDLDATAERRSTRLGFAAPVRWDYALRLADSAFERSLLLWQRPEAS